MIERDNRPAKYIPEAITAFGVGTLVVNLWAAWVFVGIEGILTTAGLVWHSIALASCGWIAFGGYWLKKSDLGIDRYSRVGMWFGAFTFVFLGINLTIMYLFPATGFYESLAWAIFAMYLGGAGGLIVGLVEGRAIERAVGAERVAVRTEQIEAQRQWLDYLNSLLRHEVLNNAAIIQGYASLLLEKEDIDAHTEDYLETIEHQSQDMTDIVHDVRALIQATNQFEDFEPVDIDSVLREEINDLEQTFGHAAVELASEEPVYVEADDLLPRVFSNLLVNAVEHNPSDTPQVDITVEATGETVRIAVTDNGTGIDGAERETLFERGEEADHGFGLYLVRVLVNRYDGSIELTETGPDGSTFTVEFPPASEPPEEKDGTSASSKTAEGRREPIPADSD